MKYILSVITIGSFLLLSCGKKESAPSAVTPTNLTLNAVVSTDNSGNVAFTATATNATTYDYDFGNGVFQTVPSGMVTYKYPAAGTYTVNVIAKSSTGQTASKSTQITVAVAQSLVFSDEFDANGAPDPSKWGYDIGTGSGGWGNNELQYYTNRLDNAFVSNGTLKIKAIKENFITLKQIKSLPTFKWQAFYVYLLVNYSYLFLICSCFKINAAIGRFCQDNIRFFFFSQCLFQHTGCFGFA